MKKRLLCVMIILSVISAAVFADTDLDTSKTNDVTAGIFSEDQDNYLSVTEFTSVEDNKLFLNLGSPIESAGEFWFGTANWWDGFYLATMFEIDEMGKDGNLSADGSTTETTDIDYLNATDGSPDTVRTQIDTTEDATFYFDNSAAVLVGVGNLGIKLTAARDQASEMGTMEWDDNGSDPDFFTHTVQQATSNEIIDEDMSGTELSKTVKDYSGGENLVINDLFGLEVGTSIDAGMPLDVAVSFNFGMVTNDQKVSAEEYRTVANAGYAEYDGMDDVEYSMVGEGTQEDSYMSLMPGLYVGTSFDTPLLGGSELAVSLDYDMTMWLNNADTYDYESTEYATDLDTNPGFIKTTTTVEEYNGEETTDFMQHVITPKFTVTKDFGDSVMVGISYKPIITLSTQEDVKEFGSTTTTTVADGSADIYDDKVTVVETVNPKETKVTEKFSYDYEIGTAAQFFITERFRFNAGATATVSALEINSETVEQDGIKTVTTTSTYPDEDGTTYTDSYTATITNQTTPEQTQYNSYMNVSVAYEAGLTFFYSDSMSVDLKANMGSVTDNVFSFDTWTAEFAFSY